jgi:hypothetical protein
MTSYEFRKQKHVFDMGDCVIKMDECVCLGFVYGARLSMWQQDSDDYGFVVWSKERVPVLAAFGGRDYKRFPMKRFAAYLLDLVKGRDLKNAWQEKAGYRTKAAFLAES